MDISLFQIPTPTPRPPPPPAPIIIDAADWSLWHFVDEAVGWWNEYPSVGHVVQIVLAFMLVFLITGFVLRSIRSFDTGSREE